MSDYVEQGYNVRESTIYNKEGQELDQQYMKRYVDGVARLADNFDCSNYLPSCPISEYMNAICKRGMRVLAHCTQLLNFLKLADFSAEHSKSACNIGLGIKLKFRMVLYVLVATVDGYYIHTMQVPVCPLQSPLEVTLPTHLWGQSMQSLFPFSVSETALLQFHLPPAQLNQALTLKLYL